MIHEVGNTKVVTLSCSLNPYAHESMSREEQVPYYFSHLCGRYYN